MVERETAVCRDADSFWFPQPDPVLLQAFVRGRCIAGYRKDRDPTFAGHWETIGSTCTAALVDASNVDPVRRLPLACRKPCASRAALGSRWNRNGDDCQCYYPVSYPEVYCSQRKMCTIYMNYLSQVDRATFSSSTKILDRCDVLFQS